MKIIIVSDERSLESIPGSDETFLEGSYNIFEEKYGNKNILIQCPEDLTNDIKKIIPSSIVSAEPLKRGTAPAVGLAMVRLMANNPKSEKIAIAYSDHPIKFKERLIESFEVAEKFFETIKKTILIAVNPTFPSTTYGYAKIGKVLQEINGKIAFEMVAFKEKPDLENAKLFMSSWRYLWNTGYMITSINDLLNIYKKVLPAYYKGLMTIYQSAGTEFEKTVTETIYTNFKKISIDQGIYEKIDGAKIGILPVDLQIDNFEDY